jgi:hypothetical protein
MHWEACKLCGSLYRFSVYENICSFYNTGVLAIISKLGGGDNSILWLSFAQQKKLPSGSSVPR